MFQFFTKHPGMRKLYINHGYEAQISAEGATERVRSSAQMMEQVAPDGTITELENVLVTSIVGVDGKPCVVSGKSEWSYEDIKKERGINGALDEWLACGGLSNKLDEGATGLSKEKLVKLRMTGVHLDLSITTNGPVIMTNALSFGGPSSTRAMTLRVSARKEMATAQSMAYTDMYRVDTLPGAKMGEYRYRTSRGIQVHVSTSGTFEYYDQSALITAIVNSIVILQLPGQIILAIAVFGIGLLSEIYYAAQSQRLNISAQFHGAVARYMNSTAAFRQITGQGGKIQHGMTFAELRKQMKAVFHSDIYDEKLNPDGDLDQDEFDQMVRIIMFGMDRGHHEQKGDEEHTALEDGDISCDEYIRACGSNEVVRLRHITKFFDDERKRSFMEKLFDDTVVDAPPAKNQDNPDTMELFDGFFI
jgi:hypothetical protein